MWRELVSNFMNTDYQRRLSNPGVKNFNILVKDAMEMNKKQQESNMEEVKASRVAARQEIYKRYPQATAEAMGVDTTNIPGNIPTPPAGFQPTQFVTDESGQTKTVYEPPGANAPQPSWRQQQKIQALKTGLRMGKVVIGREFGEPSIYDTTTMEDALRAIQDAGLDPSLFGDELVLYDVIETRVDKKTKRKMQRLRDGRIIWSDTKELIK